MHPLIATQDPHKYQPQPSKSRQRVSVSLSAGRGTMTPHAALGASLAEAARGLDDTGVRLLDRRLAALTPGLA
jgi:hypothetical protein